MTKLCEIAYKYGTDKCPQLGHSYTPIYYELLKDKNFKKILEIGIGGAKVMQWTPDHYQEAASLKMWRDFFPEAQIYGVDYEPSVMYQGERIETHLCNTTKGSQVKVLLDRIGADFDLVIDDGNHRLSSQLRTFGNLMPFLKKEVIYVIEDSKSAQRIAEELGNDYYCLVYKKPKHKQDSLVIIRNK